MIDMMDETLALKAIKEKHNDFQYVSDEIKNSLSFVMECLKPENGIDPFYVLSNCNESFCSNSSVIEASLNGSGNGFEIILAKGDAVNELVLAKSLVKWFNNQGLNNGLLVTLYTKFPTQSQAFTAENWYQEALAILAQEEHKNQSYAVTGGASLVDSLIW